MVYSNFYEYNTSGGLGSSIDFGTLASLEKFLEVRVWEGPPL